jgi:nucleotide-binding universal stress UspA family protein
MKTILVATDFSKASDNAVYYAADLGKYLNAKLILVNAFSLPVTGIETLQSFDVLTVLKSNSQLALLKIKNDLNFRLGFDIVMECVSELGSAFELITETSKKISADLIVMGMASNLGNFKQQIIGSNTISVARNIRMPLLIVPENVKYKRILKMAYACDYNENQDMLLNQARNFCDLFNAKFELVIVQKPEEELIHNYRDNNALLEKQFFSISHKKVVIRNDDVSEALDVYVQINKPDLILINPQKHNLFYRLFYGSVTKDLIFKSNLPLIILH